MTAQIARMPMLALLLILTFLSGPASASTAGAEKDHPRAFPAPGDVPVEELWALYLREASPARVEDERWSVLDAILDDDGEIIDSACRDHLQEISELSAINPVSIAAWYYHFRCADSVGDAAQSERAFEAFRHLSQYALSRLPHLEGGAPIRVLNVADAYALVLASGHQILDVYYEALPSGRHLPLHFVLWDADEMREHHMTFDFVDTLLTVSRHTPEAEFPHLRFQEIRGALPLLANAGDPAAIAALQVREALFNDDPARRIELLVHAAQVHTASAIGHLMVACLQHHHDTCGDALRSAVLPYAESEHGKALVYLALMYSQGLGVDKDQKVAAKLLDQAERQFGDGSAAVLFAAFGGSKRGFEIPDFVHRDLKSAARMGNAAARLLIAVGEYDANPPGKRRLKRRTVRDLQAAADAGSLRAALILAWYLVDDLDDMDRGIPYLRRAAALGQPFAQAVLARMIEDGQVVASSPEEAEHLYVQSGFGGHGDASMAMAERLLAITEDAEAQRKGTGWLTSAAHSGHTGAMLRLAQMMERNASDSEGAEQQAVHWYRRLLQVQPSSEAREGLAFMLMRRADDPKALLEAYELLLVEAQDSDNARAQLRVGLGLISGRFGEADPETGMNWIRRSANQGFVPAMLSYAARLYAGDNVAPDREGAFHMFEKALETESPLAFNDFAWLLCATPHEEDVDALRGVALMESIDTSLPQHLAFADTLAACHAAAGQFANAVDLQRQVLEAARSQEDMSETSLADFAGRLELFERGQRYTDPQLGPATQD